MQMWQRGEPSPGADVGGANVPRTHLGLLGLAARVLRACRERTERFRARERSYDSLAWARRLAGGVQPTAQESRPWATQNRPVAAAALSAEAEGHGGLR